jgi:anthranilate phosphoribosyltransferase
MIHHALHELLERRDLSRDESRDVMDSVMRGEATPAQIGGFLIALRLKGETADEIAGFAEAMRAHVVPVRPERAATWRGVGTNSCSDTSGTGGCSAV